MSSDYGFGQSRLSLLFAVAFASACSGSDSLDRSLDGLYETVSQQKKQPCDAGWVEQAIDAKYFRLEATSLMGVAVLARYDCESAELSTCSELMSLFESMAWMEGGWQYRQGSAVFTDVCTVTLNQGRPAPTATGFDLELTSRQGVISGVTMEKCDSDAIDSATPDQLACKSIKLLSAKRL